MATKNSSTETGLLATAIPSAGSRLTSKAQTNVKVLPKKFLVHFRRPQDYDGSYGFDWLQPEFEHYISSFDLKKEYKPTKLFGVEYLTPWLSIAKGQTAEKVYLAIEELDNTLTLSDNDVIKLPPQKGIRFYPEEVKATDMTDELTYFPTGTGKGKTIDIICDEDIPFDTVVNVYNQDNTIIGRLALLANDKEFVLPIRVVTLVREGFESQDEQSLQNSMTAQGSDFASCSTISDCMDKLEDFMNHHAYNQAFVRCKLERESNNVVKTHRVTLNETEWKNKGYINANGQLVDQGNLINELLTIYKQQCEKYKSDFFKGVILFITNVESEMTTTIVNKKTMLYEQAMGTGNLNIIDDRNCIIYRNGIKGTMGGITDKSTYIHEIGHVLSLSHPFELWNFQKILNDASKVQEIKDYLDNPNVPQLAKNNYLTQSVVNYCKHANRKAWLYTRNRYTFYINDKQHPETGVTQCMYMDYDVDRKVFTQRQWRTIQEGVKVLRFSNTK